MGAQGRNWSRQDLLSGLDDEKYSRFVLRNLNLNRAFQDAKREQALDKSKNEG